MVFSYYIKFTLYNFFWYINRAIRKNKKYILYCEDAFDIILYQNIGEYLENIDIVAKNSDVKKKLKSLGYHNVSTLPSFPDAVIMFRNMAWKFPCKKIVKIGFKHGAFNFKRHSKAEYYNMFNLFFLTSSKEIDIVRALGVTIELAVAYPKIDHLFRSTAFSTKDIQHLSSIINPSKKTLLFASTWDKSGMSAIDKWYDKISLLKSRFNLLVTVHDWMSEKYKKALRSNPDVFFIEELDRLKYIKIADICINDTSSLIAESCLLDKPLITFKVDNTARTISETMDLIDKISLRIDKFDELERSIDIFLENKDLFKKERELVSNILFDKPDGYSGKRAAERIKSLLEPFSSRTSL